MTTNCARQGKNPDDCPCTYPGCPRHGNCCQCVAHHRGKGQLAACFFTPEEERTFDRSVSFFVACRTPKA